MWILKKKVCLLLALLKTFRTQYETISPPLPPHASDSYFLLIKKCYEVFVDFIFSSFCGCCRQKHSDIDLISEIPCPKASNQNGAVSLNSPRNSTVLGAWCKKWQQEMKSSEKEIYCISNLSRNHFPIHISRQVA